MSYGQRHQYDTRIKDINLVGNKVRRAFKSWHVNDITAELVLTAADGSSVTAGRVVAGALLAGPVGAVVGAMAKKAAQSGYLIINTPNGEYSAKVSGRAVAQAHHFMLALERVQARNLKTVEAA